jgi:hypothetical protein
MPRDEPGSDQDSDQTMAAPDQAGSPAPRVLAETFADFAASVGNDDIRYAVRVRACHHILDTLRTALGRPN